MSADERCEPEAYEGGAGSYLVLLHGLGGTWHIWKPVLAALSDRHRVIAMTLPGHDGGRALPAGSEATVAVMADQLIAQLRQRGVTSAHVAGNSLGGWLALELARRGFAKSVVAFSPAGAWSTPKDYVDISRSFRILFALMPIIIVLTMAFLRFAAVRRLLCRPIMEHGDRIPGTEMLAMFHAMNRTRILPALLETMGRDGPIAPLNAGLTPIRIVWGGSDRTIPFERYGRPMMQRVAGTEGLTLAGAGHVPMFDDPQGVGDAILAVTAGVDAGQSSGAAAC
jgi:pimeloyl-ACP methyl ester carboxylesterase